MLKNVCKGEVDWVGGGGGGIINGARRKINYKGHIPTRIVTPTRCTVMQQLLQSGPGPMPLNIKHPDHPDPTDCNFKSEKASAT